MLLILYAVAVFRLPLALLVLADDTGISDAMYAIARLLAGAVGGPIAVVLVIEGYQYMFTRLLPQ